MSKLNTALLTLEDPPCQHAALLASCPVTALAGVGRLLREIADQTRRDRRVLRAWLALPAD